MNTIVALLISGMIIFIIGYFGLKLFNKINKREVELGDNLLSQNYVRLNDDDNPHFKQHQHIKYSYIPPKGMDSASITGGPGERTNSFDSQSSTGNLSSMFSPKNYSTPDPN